MAKHDERILEIREEFKAEIQGIFTEARESFREDYDEWADTDRDVTSEMDRRVKPIDDLVKVYNNRMPPRDMVASLAEACSERCTQIDEGERVIETLVRFVRKELAPKEAIDLLKKVLVNVRSERATY